MALSTGEAMGDGHWLVKTETEVPVPFVANVTTAMLYEITEGQQKVTLRYQLKASSSLTAYDGFMVLEAIDEHTTRFTELDALNANWGILKVSGRKGVWEQTLEPMYQSDVALKLLAENPQMTGADAQRAAIRMTKSQTLEPCLKEIKEWVQWAH